MGHMFGIVQFLMSWIITLFICAIIAVVIFGIGSDAFHNVTPGLSKIKSRQMLAGEREAEARIQAIKDAKSFG